MFCVHSVIILSTTPGFVKRPVWACQTAFFASQNGPFCMLKRPVLQLLDTQLIAWGYIKGRQDLKMQYKSDKAMTSMTTLTSVC